MRDAAGGQIGHGSPVQAAVELIDQPRLADAGLADHPHNLPPSLLHLRQQRPQGLQLAGTPHERRPRPPLPRA
jgi:hypothetical protein